MPSISTALGAGYLPMGWRVTQVVPTLTQLRRRCSSYFLGPSDLGPTAIAVHAEVASSIVED